MATAERKSKRKKKTAPLVRALRAVVARMAEGHRDQAERDAEALISAGVDTWEALAAEAGKDRPVERRMAALWFLSRLGGPRAIEPLLAALTDNAPEVRAEAARDMGVLRDDAAIAPLAAALERDPNTDVRAMAANALGSFPSVGAAAALSKALRRSGEDPKIRGMAAEGLALAGGKMAVEPLIEALSDPSPEVRFWAAVGLGGLGDTAALPALRRLSEAEGASPPGARDVREEAVKAIENIEASIPPTTIS